MTGKHSDLPRIIRYAEREAETRQSAAPQFDQIERLREDVRAAQQRYSDALRAFPPSYYEQMATPQTVSTAKPAYMEPQPQDELLDHNYDGIQEYDNPTPGWWYAIFAGTVVFSLLYVMVYHTLVPRLPERHAAAEARALEARFAELNSLPMGEDKILAIMGQDSWLAQGEGIYQGKGICFTCHGADGAGLVGPNLTDEIYKNIDSLVGIADLITNGSANGAMPSQKNMLNENEIALVTAYVASLRGQNLPTNPLVIQDYQQGGEIDPWPEPITGP
jgi:cytochrome c oxidase cbb3-type subunit 3